MNIEKIKHANTINIGKEIIYYEELDSTQDEAKRIVDKPISNGTIIITDNQTKGKGTKGRKWYSAKGKNITITIVLYPNCYIKDINKITIKIAETIQETIKELYGIELKIKEPNDLMLNNKKIAGILTETSTISNKINHMLIGIGLNVNQIEFPEETINIATSLKKEYNKDFNIEELIIKIIEKIEKIIN